MTTTHLATTNPTTHRTRWAAIGAAIAVTLGAGGLGVVDAVQSTGERGAYTAIEPCRLVDTRPDPDLNVGGRTTPLGPDETFQIQGTGTNGQCTGIPNDAIALALNVTPVGPTRPTNLRLWPRGPVPNASSLNPAPGQPPTPNAVTVDLAGDGSFLVYNFQGQVHLVADVVGYYRHHNHDDRYHTTQQVNAALASKADTNDVYTRVQSNDRYSRKPRTIIVPPAAFQVGSDTGDSAISVTGPGAYIFGGSHNALSAALTLPVGARITSIRYHFFDMSAADGMVARVERMGISGSFIGEVAGSSADTDGSNEGYLIREVSVDHVVSTAEVLQLEVGTLSQPWTSATSNLRIMAVEIDYVLP